MNISTILAPPTQSPHEKKSTHKMKYVIVKTILDTIRNSRDVERFAQRVQSFSGVVVESELGFEDYFSFGMCTNFVRNKFMDVIIVWLLVMAGMIYGLGELTYANSLVGLAAFCCVYLFLLSVLVSTSHTNGKRIAYGFSEEGLYLHDEHSFLKMPWINVLVKESKRYYFLYYSRFGGFIIPKRDLPDWAVEMINEYVVRFTLKKKKTSRTYK